MLDVYVDGKKSLVSDTAQSAEQILKSLFCGRKAFAVENDKIPVVQNMPEREARQVLGWPTINAIESKPKVTKVAAKKSPKKKAAKKVVTTIKMTPKKAQKVLQKRMAKKAAKKSLKKAKKATKKGKKR